jgi:hypothetical protein
VADVEARLRELAGDCRVRLGAGIAGTPDEGGSGVWIAPGTLLTCAHVAPGGRNSKVQVGWRGLTLDGTVTDQVPDASDGNLWPYPDIAVVVVEDAPQHPCAWLSEAEPISKLLAFGHSGALGEGLQPAEIEGRHGGSHGFGGGRFWQFKGNELVSGMSGGPVLDLSTGAVCGIVTVTIGEGADRGGYVVPIEGLRRLGVQRRQALLRSHDRFHGSDRRWTELRARLSMPFGPAGFPITATEEVELLHLLAQFPAADPDDLLGLLGGISADRRVLTPPGALRDAAYALLDSGSPDPEIIMSVLRLTHHLVGSVPEPAHLDLYNWATALAARREQVTELRSLRRAPALKGGRGGVVSVEIVPGSARADLFRLTVSVQQEQRGRQPIYQDPDPIHTLDQVKKVACGQLRIALGWLAGNARVEFVVPMELFDEPFDELVVTRPYTNLGRKYCVVLRDYDRQFDPLTEHDWRRRWQTLQNPSRGIRWITCAENMTAGEFSAELEQHPEIVVIALTRRPSAKAGLRDMLQVALDSGVPVAVWRRDNTCPEHDASPAEPSCVGQRFQLAFDPFLSTPSINELPEAVRQLRNKAARQNPSPVDGDCQGIVLLWDDPAQAAQPVAPVREPPHQPLEDAS